MKNKHEYINRHGDKYTFTLTKKGTILWEGPFNWCRFIVNDKQEITMIDPSGGPYVTVGMKSEFVYPEIKGKQILILKEVKKGYEIILEEKDDTKRKSGSTSS